MNGFQRWCVLVGLVVGLTGCGGVERFYVPDPVPIPSHLGLKPHFEPVCSVQLLNNQTTTDKIFIGNYTHKWWANLRSWSDASIGLVAKELAKRGVERSEESDKIVKMAVTDADVYWQFHQIGCVVNLRVETGDGYVVNIEERHMAKDLYDACNGATTKAVATLFQDRNVLGYLAAVEKPQDEDCDGVPNQMDQCPGTPREAEVDARGCPLDADGDGIPDYLDDCPDTPQGVTVDQNGCPLDSDNDGVPDYQDACPDTPPGMEVDDQGCPRDSDGDGVMDLDDHCPKTPKGAYVDEYGCWNSQVPLFAFDKATIQPEYHSYIDEVAQIVQGNPDLQVEIMGHADIIGPESYNKELSRKRAEAVRRYLIDRHGISPHRLSAQGYGENQPRAPSATEHGRAMNRRVEFRPIW